ncbi:MAG: histidine--tRNA ligase [Acholeplasmataceae bacterium]|nr:histidine--tRNA ligase [Acholeplasmataceae bacterium]
MNYKVKGTYDVLPHESHQWIELERKIREILSLYNMREIRTPMMEYSQVFHRESEGSDMVTKETYNFLDRSNRELTLRPEGTAGVIRSYVEHKLYATQELEKVYYIGPNFRYERPQKGRYRQFYQFGVEAIGSSDPKLDAEMIILAYDFINRLKLKDVVVKINSLGDDASRANYQKALTAHFLPHKETLCKDCQERLEKNPLRILDCKVDAQHPAVLSAPSPLDLLNESSKNHFEIVKEHLKETDIHFVIEPKLVRGLDYYSHTVFEVDAHIEGFGAQNTLGGGGRYQNMIQEMGGPDLGAVGFAFGMERLLIALNSLQIDFSKDLELDVYILTTSLEMEKPATKLLYNLRKANWVADMNYTQKAFKGQLRQALRLKAKYLVILGDEEYAKQTVSVKNTETEVQETVALSSLIEYLKDKLEK